MEPLSEWTEAALWGWITNSVECRPHVEELMRRARAGERLLCAMGLEATATQYDSNAGTPAEGECDAMIAAALLDAAQRIRRLQ